MTCPHEQLRGRCYHPSLAPWPGNCLDDDTCPRGFGPWGAWRAVLAVVEDAARHEGEMGNLKRIANAVNTLGAVGWWSP